MTLEAGVATNNVKVYIDPSATIVELLEFTVFMPDPVLTLCHAIRADKLLITLTGYRWAA